MLLVDASAGPSAIHGTGLIANQFIPAGTLVWALRPEFDVILTQAQLDALPVFVQAQIRRFIYVEIDTGRRILCSDDAKYMNHADHPNTSTRGEQTTAIRDIAKGEELTGDYCEFDAASRNSGVQLESDTSTPVVPTDGATE